ncbi:hypothetical protein D8M05_11340 [Oceanobacillus bengalensis]|uniref:Uncharacterized protein n=2 Tax=Oceanobacillus bengalensis TaxID=1435466 RepID=A0A494YXU1_9BACI|nr:hypothetical protein [Oceanobacillus bengalensis]RKQ15045.1 hypothetical protein D8M05_11340 [Oceanobacillus bengalensis]
MCFSYSFIEQQTHEMSKKIWDSSLYKLIRIDFAGGNCFKVQSNLSDWVSLETEMGNKSTLITKVILEDIEGKHYSIEPNDNGLRFAKGELTYKEYKNLQEKGNALWITIFIVGFLLIFTLMSVLVKFVL